MKDFQHIRRTMWEREEGNFAPPGATWLEEEQGWNFALFSRFATGVTLLLFSTGDFFTPVFQLRLNPLVNKTGRIWHSFVPRSTVPSAGYYAYRVEGPLGSGHRFDPDKILFDPFAEKVFFPPEFSREAARHPGRNDGQAVLGVLPPPEPAPSPSNVPVPRRRTHDAIIYELHVKGFTARANSGVTKEKRGTFLGLIERIPYLKELGVTIVELLPVHQFDPQEGNYWGYMTLSFLAAHHAYGVNDAVSEFQEMVRAFHQVGIEVWLDVVFGHTCEGDASGPTYSYRGIDNRSYYLIDSSGNYLDATGCGNTTRCAGSIVRAMVMRSLAYWAEWMEVDGFRFDLASVLARNEDGSVNTESPALVADIGFLAAFFDLRIVAEAWDISAYLLGRSFPGWNWGQWNGQFRDDVRAFVKGDAGMVGALMRRLYGSDDLFPDGPGDVYRPFQSINFITCHDGFCLYDLVSYNQKHNEANGQGNRDGSSDNKSWNCGWEGEDGAPTEVLNLRVRQAKNFCALLMLANGTPMFCAGDEFLNTQRGNNNPYNQDNEVTWLDWSRLDRHREVFRFFQQMIAFRKAHRSISRSRYWRDDIHWYGQNGPVDLSWDAHSLAYHLNGKRFNEPSLYVMINAYWEPVTFRIQEGRAGDWQRVIDTSLASPEDIGEGESEAQVLCNTCEVQPRSVVVLERKRTEDRL